MGETPKPPPQALRPATSGPRGRREHKHVTQPTMSSQAFHFVSDPLFSQHRARVEHPERPERLAAARRGVDAVEAEGARLVALPARDATGAELLRVHDAGYIASLLGLKGQSAMLDADTYVVPASVDAARRAAGGAIALV